MGFLYSEPHEQANEKEINGKGFGRTSIYGELRGHHGLTRKKIDEVVKPIIDTALDAERMYHGSKIKRRMLLADDVEEVGKRLAETHRLTSEQQKAVAEGLEKRLKKRF